MWRLFKIYVKKRNQFYLRPTVMRAITNLCGGDLEAYTTKAKLRYFDPRKVHRVNTFIKHTTK